MMRRGSRLVFLLGISLGFFLWADRALANATTVLQPNGGECLTVGQSYTIQFSYSGVNVEHVALYYRTDGQQPAHLDSSVIKHPINVPQQGTSWNWTPGAGHISENGRIWIDGHDNGHVTLNIWDQSNANFAVRSSCAGGGGGGGTDSGGGQGGKKQTPIPPPVLQRLDVYDIGTTGAKLAWATDRYSYTKLMYGTRTDVYPEEFELDPVQRRINHQAQLDNLEPGTTYYFRILSGRMPGEEVQSEEQTLTTLKEPDLTPPAPVSDLFTLTGAGSILISWINPADKDFKETMVVRRTDRFAVNPDEEEVVGRGSQPFHREGGLDNRTTYYYSIFTLDNNGNRSLPTELSLIPRLSLPEVPSVPLTPAAESLPRLTNLSSEPQERSITLRWKNPARPDFLGTQVVRNELALPAHPFDGRIVYRGRNQTFTDTDLQNEQRYWYGLFPFDWESNFGPGAFIAEIPSFIGELLNLKSKLDDIQKVLTQFVLNLWSRQSSLEHLVVGDGNGYQPQSLTVSAGDTVRWLNKDKELNWPASDPHPIHTNYPSFDAFRGLKEGESYFFTFKERGSWSYHNHLNPRQTGQIIVK